MSQLDRPIIAHKAELIDWAAERFGITSLVDLGACWGVNGGYTFHAVSGHPIDRAVIVDGDITGLTRQRAAGLPQVEMVQGGLADEDVVAKVGRVDAAIMFDILLHQVAPDWDEFIGRYAPNVDTLIIYNQNWVGPETVRFIDFGLEDYLRRVPHSNEARIREWFAQHGERNQGQGKLWRDVHNFWQWGLTEKDMVRVLWDAGYRIERLENFGAYDPKFPEVALIGIVCHKRDRPLQPPPPDLRAQPAPPPAAAPTPRVRDRIPAPVRSLARSVRDRIRSPRS